MVMTGGMVQMALFYPNYPISIHSYIEPESSRIHKCDYVLITITIFPPIN